MSAEPRGESFSPFYSALKQSGVPALVEARRIFLMGEKTGKQVTVNPVNSTIAKCRRVIRKERLPK